ncbi:DNA mismatch repair protein MutS [Halteromyces radiatus]|uniref:DNA mismatch repair protein MutS n=1 Tax=Halteromyces radiatus TaxID=101107 RepID=UPI0022207608|nr:DNA mismatch repair protein MutS [Halteromyces radiatus]KAI8085171.1 DNA mismatch repair protein MutS [Halteromyces radiatus]
MSSQTTNSLQITTENEDQDLIIVSLYWKSNKLGCIYYLHQFHELYFLEDIKEINLKDTVEALIFQLCPTHMVLCAFNNPELTNIVKKYDDRIQIEILNSKEFTYQKGLYELINWYIGNCTQQHHSMISTESNELCNNPSLQDEQSEIQFHASFSDTDLTKQAQLRLSSLVPLTSTTTSSSFGSYHTSMMPMVLKSISFLDTMYVSADVMQSLEIFQIEMHPSTHQKKGKESMSLFNLLNYTVSPGGTHLLKQWLLRPTLDLEVLQERHSSVEYLINVGNPTNKDNAVKKLSSYMKHVKNTARILSHIHEHHAKVTEWQQLLEFSYYVLKIVDVIKAYHLSQAPILQKVISTINIDILTHIGKCINDQISFEDSHAEGRLTIKSGVDKDLDLLREKYNCLDDYLLQVAQDIAIGLPNDIGNVLNVVYFPQLGYLVTFPCSVYTRYVDHSCLNGFDLQFSTGDNYYYKNNRMRNMDEHLGDMYGMIIDKQIEMIQHLSERIILYQEQLLATTEVLAELDCILAFSIAALQNGYTRPIMTDDDLNELTIVEGRHPLQELKLDIFISNDTYIAGGNGRIQENEESFRPATEVTETTPTVFNSSQLSTTKPSSSSSSPFKQSGDFSTTKTTRTSLSTRRDNYENESPHLIYNDDDERPRSVILLTGANFSGKSVYLKQIGLIVFMAHIGSFVPAARAVIGLTDKIFTSIQTIESVSTAHSAFGYDLQQVSQGLHYATQKSLVIIDEFGKGTNPVDGASLFAAVLNEYINRGRQCPKLVTSTHFHELLTQDILIKNQNNYIQFYTTEIICNINNKDQNGNQVVFLYKVVPGYGLGASFGIWCASLAGISEDVLQRANQLTNTFINGTSYQEVWTIQDQDYYNKLEQIKEKFITVKEFTNDFIISSGIVDSLSSLFLQ